MTYIVSGGALNSTHSLTMRSRHKLKRGDSLVTLYTILLSFTAAAEA